MSKVNLSADPGQVHLARQNGAFEQAAAYYEDSLDLFRQIGDRRGMAYSLCNLGKASLETGESEKALHLHEKSLRLYEDLRDKSGRAFALINLGDAAQPVGDEERTVRLMRPAKSCTRRPATERVQTGC